MAYSILPEPGGEYLCSEPCHHRDCAELRRKLAETCRLCGSQMQPFDRYCNDELNEDRIVHWACDLARIEAPA